MKKLLIDFAIVIGVTSLVFVAGVVILTVVFWMKGMIG